MSLVSRTVCGPVHHRRIDPVIQMWSIVAVGGVPPPYVVSFSEQLLLTSQLMPVTPFVQLDDVSLAPVFAPPMCSWRRTARLPSFSSPRHLLPDIHTLGLTRTIVSGYNVCLTHFWHRYAQFLQWLAIGTIYRCLLSVGVMSVCERVFYPG